MSKADTRLILARDIDTDLPVVVNMQNDNVMNDTRMVLDGFTQTLMVSQRINDTNDHFTQSIDVHEWNAAWIRMFIRSTLAPTDIRFVPIFGWGDGVQEEFVEGLWASMFFEDTDTAAPGIHRTFLLPCGGVYFVQFRIVATGANVNNYFTVEMSAQLFRGNFGVAHA